DNLAAFYVEKTFGLKAPQISRHQFADRAEFRGQILMAFVQLDVNAFFGLDRTGFCKANDQSDKPLANRGERKFFDNSNKAAQAGTHDCDNLQRNVRVFLAEILKVFSRYENDFSVLQSGCRCRIATSIKNGQLRERTAGAFHGQDLFATRRGEFEDANFSRGDKIKPIARITFGEKLFVFLELPSRGASRESTYLLSSQAREKGRLLEDEFGICVHTETRFENPGITEHSKRPESYKYLRYPDTSIDAPSCLLIFTPVEDPYLRSRNSFF
ncbi:MAG TPA: hypothetical protein VEU98_02880, partial [Candidatus Eremiobacteraceae bacterium]|nr:hypothetical protein [Candidatus Eremiobacteraceae bacterium]